MQYYIIGHCSTGHFKLCTKIFLLEGKDLSAINSDTENAFEEYRKKISSICYEFYEIGLKEQVKRDNEIKLFNVIVNEGKSKVQNDSKE